MRNVNLVGLICGSCGARLPEPGNGIYSKRVKCEYCGTLHLIDSYAGVGGAESLYTAKAMTGMNFAVDSDTEDLIREKVKKYLMTSKCVPLDVFSDGEIVSVRRIGIPAYWYDDCTIRGHIIYEKRYTYVTYHEEGSEWRPHTMDVSEVRDFIVSANRKYDEIIKAFYYGKDLRGWQDVSYLDELSVEDIQEVDTPAGSAFLANIHPELEPWMLELAKEKLLPKADEQKTFLGMSINTDEIRNIQVSGVENSKSEPKMIWIGICEVLYQYKEEMYSIYLSHDGRRIWSAELPVDEQRSQRIQEARMRASEMDSQLHRIEIGYTIGTLTTIIAGMISLMAGTSEYDWESKLAGVLLGLLILAGGVLLYRKGKRKRAELLPEVVARRDEYETLENAVDDIPKEVNVRAGVFEKLMKGCDQ